MIAESPNRDSGSATRARNAARARNAIWRRWPAGPIDNRLRLLFTVAG
jgi:hypothetical protein